MDGSYFWKGYCFRKENFFSRKWSLWVSKWINKWNFLTVTSASGFLKTVCHSPPAEGWHWLSKFWFSPNDFSQCRGGLILIGSNPPGHRSSNLWFALHSLAGATPPAEGNAESDWNAYLPERNCRLEPTSFNRLYPSMEHWNYMNRSRASVRSFPHPLVEKLILIFPQFAVPLFNDCRVNNKHSCLWLVCFAIPLYDDKQSAH